MAYHYSDPSNETDSYKLPDFEVFHSGDFGPRPATNPQARRVGGFLRGARPRAVFLPM